MKRRLVRALASLASKPYQEAYVIGGTANDYVLPEEILEEVGGICAMVECEPYRKLFSDQERRKLQEVLAAIRTPMAIDSPNASAKNYDLILHDSAWAKARSIAAEYLLMLGVDIQQFRADQIDEIADNFND